jgi:hypothetical protein
VDRPYFDRCDVKIKDAFAALYLRLWNRADPAAAGVTVSGDPRVLQAWRDGVQVRWR